MNKNNDLEKKEASRTGFFQHFLKNYLAYIVIISGFLGTFTAFTLLTNRIEYYKNPDFIPPCSVNVWLDCGIVMKSKWASLFGFPNTIIGLITYPMAVLTGLFILLNPKNNKYLMLFCTGLSGLGLVVNLVLLYISSYLIASLCPWCLLAGVATSNIFFALTVYCINQDHLSFSPQTQLKLKKLIKGFWTIPAVVAYYLIIVLFVWFSFLLRDQGVDTREFFDPIFWKWNELNFS